MSFCDLIAESMHNLLGKELLTILFFWQKIK